MNDAMMAETISMTGHGGDEVEAYLARPLGGGPFGSVVVIHHMPGYDTARRRSPGTFAAHGYRRSARTCTTGRRRAPAPDDAAAAARAQGGVPDERLVGDVGGAADVPARRCRLQRQGRARSATAPAAASRSSPPAACRLTRPLTVTGRSSSARRREGMPLQGWPDHRPGRGPVLPAARPVRRRRLPSVPRSDRRAGQGAHRAGQAARVPHLRGRRARVLLGGPARLPAEAATDGWQKIWDFYGRYLAG